MSDASENEAILLPIAETIINATMLVVATDKYFNQLESRLEKTVEQGKLVSAYTQAAAEGKSKSFLGNLVQEIFKTQDDGKKYDRRTAEFKKIMDNKEVALYGRLGNRDKFIKREQAEVDTMLGIKELQMQELEKIVAILEKLNKEQAAELYEKLANLGVSEETREDGTMLE
jgi:hypothetical protein